MANNTTAAVKGNITAAELWIHLTIFYTFLCGVVSTIGYVLIIVGILRSKKLRNRFFVTVGTLTFCRTLLCLQFLVMALYRMLRQVGIAPASMSRLSCHAIHFWLLIGLTIEMMLLLTLVLDRALAIIATSRYRRLTTQQALAVCTAVLLVGVIIKLPFSYANINLQQVVTCTNSYSAPSEPFNLYTQNIDLVLLVIILIVYVLLILFVHYRVRVLRSSSDTSDSNAIALKRQLKLMPLLRSMVLAHCTFALISKVLRTLAGVYDSHPEASARFTAYGGVFSTLDLFSNVVALLWSNSDIRHASLPCYKLTDTGATTQMPTLAYYGVVNKQRSAKVVPASVLVNTRIG